MLWISLGSLVASAGQHSQHVTSYVCSCSAVQENCLAYASEVLVCWPRCFASQRPARMTARRPERRPQLKPARNSLHRPTASSPFPVVLRDQSSNSTFLVRFCVLFSNFVCLTAPGSGVHALHLVRGFGLTKEKVAAGGMRTSVSAAGKPPCCRSAEVGSVSQDLGTDT